MKTVPVQSSLPRIYSDEDILKIKKACLITARALDFIEKKIVPGISTLDIDKMIENFIRREGGIPAFQGYSGYKHTVCASVNEEIVHGIPSAKKILEEGDIIGVDTGTILDGFYSDSCRTFPVGSVSEKVKRLLSVTKKALHCGIDQFFEGNHLYTLSSSIQKCIEDAGYSVVKDYVGHGIGLNLHEDPAVPNFGEAGTGLILKQGMVLAIEPMVNVGSEETEVFSDGWTVVTKDRALSAHFEHTVALTKKGCGNFDTCLRKRI